MSLLNRLLACAALSIWAANLVPPEWLSRSRAMVPNWLPTELFARADIVPNRNSAAAARYAMALEHHAQNHRGSYPVTLDVLSHFISEDEHRYLDPRTGEMLPWDLFAGATRSSPKGTLLMAAPKSDGMQRLVVLTGGKAATIPEATFQRLRANLGAPVQRNERIAQRWFDELQTYARANRGNFPTRLQAVFSGDPHQLADLLYLDPATGESLQWQYFSGYTRSSPAATLLLAAPQPYSGKRLIVRIDGTVELLSEEAFRAAVEAQPPTEW